MNCLVVQELLFEADYYDKCARHEFDHYPEYQSWDWYVALAYFLREAANKIIEMDGRYCQ